MLLDAYCTNFNQLKKLNQANILFHSPLKYGVFCFIFLPLQDENIPATPCLLYSGQGIEDADFLHLRVDKERLFFMKNAEDGLAALMAAYWIFNVEYARKAFNTLVVMERLFLGLNLTAPRVVVTKFLNRVEKKGS